MTHKLAKRILLSAGIFGVLVVAPMFFLEREISERYPPAITHPEMYYGFASVTLAWQIAYLMMSRDPARYRPMLLPAMTGKAGFAISAVVLFAQGRVEATSVVLATIDLVLVGLFGWVFWGLREGVERGSG